MNVTGVIFLQLYYCRCITEEYSGACVCAFRPLTLVPEVSLSALLCPRVVQRVTEGAKVPGVTLDYYTNS